MGTKPPSITHARVNELVKTAIKSSNSSCSGIVFHSVDCDGDVLASAVSGSRDIETGQDVTLDTVFWIASCTKLVTSIACMQLIERGKANLDDPDLVARVLPEVAAAKLLVDGVEQEQQTRITLKMLLTHTCNVAGYAYSFLWDELWNSLGQNENLDEFQGSFKSFLQPLKFQPGTEREYSIGLDWAGVLIERITGMSLGQYMNENIFQPLGLENSAMVLTDGMRSNLSSMHVRDNSGRLKIREHLNKVAQDTDGSPKYFHSGGAGLFSNATDYCKILAALLNNGLSPTTSNRILEVHTVDLMFENQIPEWQTKYAGRGHAICRTDLAVAALRDDMPVVGREGWGLSFLLGGENLQFASAAGISNCYWALDREKGTAAILFSQVLPLGDPVITPLWMELQKVVFA